MKRRNGDSGAACGRAGLLAVLLQAALSACVTTPAPEKQVGVPVAIATIAGNADGDSLGRYLAIIGGSSAAEALLVASITPSPGNGDVGGCVVYGLEPVRVIRELSKGPWTRGSECGAAIVIGDVDGDGLEDIAVGEPVADWEGRPVGRVVLYSAKSGYQDMTIMGSAQCSDGAQFGSTLALGDDYDGDGFPELIVGAYLDERENKAAGSVSIVSMARSCVLHRLESPTMPDQRDDFGVAIAVMGDCDGDGLRDIAVGSTFGRYVSIIGSREMREWKRIEGPPPDAFFGGVLKGLSSPEGPALLIGAPMSIGLRSICGAYYIHDSGKKRLIVGGHGRSPDEFLGSAFAALGDLNRDGFEEYAVGASGWNDRGRVTIHDGRSGKVLGEILGESEGEMTGYALASSFAGNEGALLAVAAPGRNGGGAVQVFLIR